jgi:hypothetical protein
MKRLVALSAVSSASRLRELKARACSPSIIAKVLKIVRVGIDCWGTR